MLKSRPFKPRHVTRLQVVGESLRHSLPVTATIEPSGHLATKLYDTSGRLVRTTFDDGSTEESQYGPPGTAQSSLVMKTKDRRNVVTTYTYDASGHRTQHVVGAAWDNDILDGNPDDTPITNRNEQSITVYNDLLQKSIVSNLRLTGRMMRVGIC